MRASANANSSRFLCSYLLLVSLLLSSSFSADFASFHLLLLDSWILKPTHNSQQIIIALVLVLLVSCLINTRSIPEETICLFIWNWEEGRSRCATPVLHSHTLTWNVTMNIYFLCWFYLQWKRDFVSLSSISIGRKWERSRLIFFVSSSILYSVPKDKDQWTFFREEQGNGMTSILHSREKETRRWLPLRTRRYGVNWKWEVEEKGCSTLVQIYSCRNDTIHFNLPTFFSHQKYIEALYLANWRNGQSWKAHVWMKIRKERR